MKKGNLILGGTIVVLLMSNFYFYLDRNFFREEYNQTVDEHNRQIEKVFNWEEENLEINEDNISETERCEKENHKLTNDYNNLLLQNKECVKNWDTCVQEGIKLTNEYNKLYAEYEKFF